MTPSVMNRRVMYTELWKKSYLIEFLNDQGLEEAFAFSVPPESESFSYGQRKTETKTFEGLRVDDYGIDSVKISLSGTTINQELKKIYRPGQNDLYLSGEDEIFYFRDLIEKYKSSPKLNCKMMLYDLSKIKYLGLGNKTATRNFWQVYPGELSIRRSNDKPFTFRYSIDFTGVDPAINTITKGVAPNWFNIDVSAFLAYVDKGAAILQDVMSWSEIVVDTMTSIRAAVKECNDILLSYINTVNGLLDNTANLAKESLFFIPDMQTYIKHYSVDIKTQFINSGQKLYNAFSTGITQAKNTLDKETVPQDCTERYEQTEAEYKDAVTLVLSDIEDKTLEIAAMVKSQIPDVIISPNEYGDTEVKAVYGYRSVPMTSTATFENLAKKYLGSSDRAIEIASFNKVASEIDIPIGDPINIPLFSNTQRNNVNQIYAQPESLDNYGIDIKLIDGNFAISETGDFAAVSGTDNLSQSILLRLKEDVNNRIRLSAYGIRTDIADPIAGTSYILSSIQQTIEADPRVESIDKVSFVGNNDSLIVDVSFTDINYSAIKFSGSI